MSLLAGAHGNQLNASDDVALVGSELKTALAVLALYRISFNSMLVSIF